MVVAEPRATNGLKVIDNGGVQYLPRLTARPVEREGAVISHPLNYWLKWYRGQTIFSPSHPSRIQQEATTTARYMYY